MGQSLAESLAAEEDIDPNEVEMAWAVEIKRRVEDVRSGKVKLIPGEQVLAELDAIVDAPEP